MIYSHVHDMCVLLGYGADAICPYLVFQAAQRLREEGVIGEQYTDRDTFQVRNFILYF